MQDHGIRGPVVQKSSLRVQVLSNWVLGFWVVVLVVQVLGKYMSIRYLDP